VSHNTLTIEEGSRRIVYLAFIASAIVVSIAVSVPVDHVYALENKSSVQESSLGSIH
jgi:hypothetical protein